MLQPHFALMRPASRLFEDRPWLRTLVLYAVAVVCGGLGWSGIMHWSWLSLLYPFVYVQSHSRRDAFSSVFYYAAATWSILPGSQTFFGNDADPLLSVALWLAVISLGSLPWIALYYRRCVDVSAVVSLILLALPPLGLVTVAYPLISAGQWFPGTRWFGLATPLLLVVSYRWIGPRYVSAALIAAVLVTHVGWRKPIADPHIVTINTHFGGSAFIPRPATMLYEQRALHPGASAPTRRLRCAIAGDSCTHLVTHDRLAMAASLSTTRKAAHNPLARHNGTRPELRG